MNKKLLLIGAFAFSGFLANAQMRVGSTPETVKALTSNYKGERFPDGRPKVPDLVLERLQNATLEQIWGYLKKLDYFKTRRNHDRSCSYGPVYANPSRSG